MQMASQFTSKTGDDVQLILFLTLLLYQTCDSNYFEWVT